MKTEESPGVAAKKTKGRKRKMCVKTSKSCQKPIIKISNKTEMRFIFFVKGHDLCFSSLFATVICISKNV